MAAPTILSQLRDALGYENAGQFAKDWKNLPDEDKAQLRSAVENGSMTY